MKVKQNLIDKPLGEVMEALNNPEKQKDLTFGDVMQLMSALEKAANASDKLNNQQPIPSDVELKLRDFDRRIKAIEDKLDAIYKAFTGGHDYD